MNNQDKHIEQEFDRMVSKKAQEFSPAPPDLFNDIVSKSSIPKASGLKSVLHTVQHYKVITSLSVVTIVSAITIYSLSNPKEQVDTPELSTPIETIETTPIIKQPLESTPNNPITDSVTPIESQHQPSTTIEGEASPLQNTGPSIAPSIEEVSNLSETLPNNVSLDTNTINPISAEIQPEETIENQSENNNLSDWEKYKQQQSQTDPDSLRKLYE